MLPTPAVERLLHKERLSQNTGAGYVRLPCGAGRVPIAWLV